MPLRFGMDSGPPKNRTVSFTDPNATKAPLPSPASNRSELMAWLLAQPQQQIQTTPELGVKLADRGLQVFLQNKAITEKKTQETQRATALAHALFPEGDPRREQFLALAQAGAVDASSLGGPLMDKLLPTPKDPVKVGKGDTLLDPNTYEPLYTPPAGAAAGDVKYGISTPTYGRDKDGKIVLLQMGDNATVKSPVLPEGVQALGPYETSAERAAGKLGGPAAANLPLIERAGNRLLDNIDAALNDPALEKVTGPVQGSTPTLLPMGASSSTRSRAQSRLDQLFGGTFLQAYNDLRGGGQITNVEGEKAEAAYNRLRTQTMSDSAYRDALREFRTEVGKLLDVARQRATQAPTMPGRDPAAAAAFPEASGTPPTSGPVQLSPENADAEYDALPSGAEFIDPEGVPRRKP